MKFGQAQTLLQMIYPSRCVGCGALVEGDFGLCGSCWRDTPFVTGLGCDACGVPLIGGTPGEIAHCDACLMSPRPWIRGRSVLVYEGMARRLVLRLKHGDRTDMAKPLAGWMERKASDLIEKDSVLVPVPLHWQRLLRRKYNQASLLAAELARRLKVDHCPDALLRKKATRPMSGDRDSRVKALEGAFVLNEKRSKVLRGRPTMLVDDVMTSGATLEAAARAIEAASPSKIDVITLARVAKDL